MNAIDPEISLLIEDCGDVTELAPYVMLVEAGMFPELKRHLNARLGSAEGKHCSQLLSQIEKGNACEVVKTDLFPLLLEAIEIVSAIPKPPPG